MLKTKRLARQDKAASEMTAKEFARLVLGNLNAVIGALASSKTQEESGQLQELALELVRIQEMTDPGEKLRAFAAIRDKLPRDCGCK